MNKTRQAIVFITTLIILIMGLFPPVTVPFNASSPQSRFYGYKFIADLSAIASESPSRGKLYSINVSFLFAEWIWVLLIGGGIFSLTATKKKGPD